MRGARAFQLKRVCRPLGVGTLQLKRVCRPRVAVGLAVIHERIHLVSQQGGVMPVWAIEENCHHPSEYDHSNEYHPVTMHDLGNG